MYKVVLLFLLLCNAPVVAQLATSQLGSIGVYSVKELEYRVTGEYVTQYLVVQIIPELPTNDNCTRPVVRDYKDSIYNILAPVNETLDIVSTYVGPYSGTKRFVAEIIAGAALGVATAAQITAGIALYEARQNAAQIEAIKSSLKHTNAAIQSLQTAQKQTVVAIRSIQDQINTKIIPQLNTLSCDLIGQQLRLSLLEYYTEILTVFGPIIQSPLNGEVTIQAIARSAGGNLTGLLNELGYNSQDLKNILEINAIRGSVVDVDPILGTLIFNIRYPTFIKIPDATIIQLAYVSFHSGSYDWMTQGPSHIMVRGYTIADVDTTQCTVGSNYLMCPRDTTKPFSSSMNQCLRGNLTYCPRTIVTDRDAPRFLVVKGNLVANCITINCKCEDPEYTIMQAKDEPLVILDNGTCKAHFVDGIRIALGPRKLPTIYLSKEIKLGPVITVNPVEVSHQLSVIEDNIENSEAHLKIAIEKLNNVPQLNGSYVSPVVAIVISVVSLCVTLVVAFLLYRYINHVQNLRFNLDTIEKGPTLAPKGHHYPGSYLNQGFSSYPSAPSLAM
ncbi:fusion protein [bank vole virus 1]|uniref:Fusion glycoprotein F0 n=1 Tax=bank vole virus 1 TaxID=2756244 RepID=A0A2H4PJ56_9MONO|nr:fusion protein [bank vole virus 1]ATW63188.1 fusion protein [bank vole virus 1]